jgi:Tfp pilus assembly protein PilF
VKTPDLLLQDAMLKANKKDYTGARTSLEAVLKMNPEDLRAVELLGRIYVVQNQVAAGTAKIRELAASQPKSARLQKFLGDWLVATGDHTGALQAYTAAKQLQPQATSIDLAMARLYQADNKNDAARQILTRVIQADSNNAEAFLWMGTLEERAGSFDAAISDYRKVLNINSNNVMALNNLAFLLAEHGQVQQLDEALKLAQQVRALAPKSGNIDDTMGWVYYKKGMYPSAIQQLEDAVSQDRAVNAPSALHHYHLAMAYLMAGKYKQGNEKLDIARRLNPNLPEAKQATALLAQTKTTAN